MKTTIPFYHKVTNIKSNCGDPLNILLSSKDMNWKGVLLERGTSPYFYPKDVITPNFYFAIELEGTYSWSAVNDGSELTINTEPGDIWINPPNTPFTHNIDVPCNFLILNISEDVMFSSFDGLVPNDITFLNNYSIQDKTLENLMHLLLVELSSGGNNGPWFVNYVMKLFANYFIRHFSNYNDLISDSSNNSIIQNEDIQKIDKFITDNISASISIENLANTLNISKFHFLNEFKKFTGFTPYQHILNTRINIAKSLLTDSNDKITVIAHKLGFSDSSHFSRTFKKVTGMSPKEYKQT